MCVIFFLLASHHDAANICEMCGKPEHGLWNCGRQILFRLDIFFGSRSLLPTDVCSLSYDRMKKKNSRKSFGLFPFSLCSRSPHANDGFQFAFAGEKMAFPMRRLGSYDGM